MRHVLGGCICRNLGGGSLHGGGVVGRSLAGVPSKNEAKGATDGKLSRSKFLCPHYAVPQAAVVRLKLRKRPRSCEARGAAT